MPAAGPVSGRIAENCVSGGRGGHHLFVNARIGSVVAATLLAATACTTSSAGTPAPTTTASSVAGRDHAELDVVSGATTVTVRAADLGGALFHADGVHTEVDGDAIRVSVRDGDTSSVHVDVATGVAWTIRLDGGATEETVDLTGGRLAALEFGAGATRIEAILPAPHGTVPVRMTGGASSFTLHLPAGVPATVRLAGGAGQASIDDVVHTGIAGGTVLSTSDWSDGADGYSVDAVAGVSAMTIDRAR